VCVYDYVILPGLNVDQQACYPVTEAPEKCLISSVLRLKHDQTIPMITNRSFYAELCTKTHTHTCFTSFLLLKCLRKKSIVSFVCWNRGMWTQEWWRHPYLS